MATFNYIHAVWRNGPGVVSDAPGWVRASIERVLTDRLPGWDSGLVGTGADGESGLGLWILVSPSAARGAGGFAGLPVGSFVHVVASDATVPPAAPDAAGHLFEAVYGPSLSDAVLRQQDAFMLLEHPYHETLAAELFVSKQLLEGDDAPSARPDPLPFDQGLSYQEVVTRLAESAMRQARTAPDTIPQLGSSPAPAPVLPAPAPGPSLAAPAPVIDPDEVGAGEEGEEIEEEGGAEPGDDLSLSALLRGGGAAKPSAAAASPLPFNEGLSYDQVLARMETALETSSGVPQTKAVRPPPAPARTSGRGRRDRPGSAFGPGAELLAAASFLVLAVLVAAAVLLRMPEAPPPATVAGDPPSQPQRAAPEPRLAPAPVVEQPPVVPRTGGAHPGGRDRNCACAARARGVDTEAQADADARRGKVDTPAGGRARARIGTGRRPRLGRTGPGSRPTRAAHRARGRAIPSGTRPCCGHLVRRRSLRPRLRSICIRRRSDRSAFRGSGARGRDRGRDGFRGRGLRRRGSDRDRRRDSGSLPAGGLGGARGG